PGIPSGTLAVVEAPALNARGDVVFLATVRRGRETIETLYVRTARGLAKVVAQGDPAPAGGTYAGVGVPALADDGTVVFGAAVDGGSTPIAIFATTAAGTRRVAAIGDRLSGGDVIRSFGLYPAVSMSPRGDVSFAIAPASEGTGVDGLVVAPPLP